eukprot:TRINITY_DN47412_c0_g1_i1.p1 TRINITY_DN47412_c0_g1~~TRINITY_DN47412_c0_g1_i1.p1  ORF type:complete len:403 (+),score=62.46 TRINITY_DN47412_c0_g1_i1:117-1211(+)
MTHRLRSRLLTRAALLCSSSLACQLSLAWSPLFIHSWILSSQTDRHVKVRAAPTCSASEGLWQIRPQDRSTASADTQLHFERNGFCRVAKLLSASEASSLAQELAYVQSSEICEMAALQHELRQHVGPALASSCQTLQDCRRTLQNCSRSGKVKFLQYFNLHRHSALLRRAAMSPRLGFWAARLLGVSQVRLYQDALFMKYPSHGPTRWHSDLGLSPFDTNSFVTAWLAMTPVPAQGGSGLRFARGSHRDYTLQYHSDLAESYTQDDLSSRYSIEEASELQPGDATWHHGWTLHAAAPLDSAARSPRVAWAVSFVASDARILPEESLSIAQEAEDSVSFEPWIRSLRPGDCAEHAMLPLLPAET